MSEKTNDKPRAVRSHDAALLIEDMQNGIRVSGIKLNQVSSEIREQKLNQDGSGTIKDNYDLGFITLPEKYDEEALENAIEQRMIRFLLELGEGWALPLTTISG